MITLTRKNASWSLMCFWSARITVLQRRKNVHSIFSHMHKLLWIQYYFQVCTQLYMCMQWSVWINAWMYSTTYISVHSVSDCPWGNVHAYIISVHIYPSLYLYALKMHDINTHVYILHAYTCIHAKILCLCAHVYVFGLHCKVICTDTFRYTCVTLCIYSSVCMYMPT